MTWLVTGLALCLVSLSLSLPLSPSHVVRETVAEALREENEFWQKFGLDPSDVVDVAGAFASDIELREAAASQGVSLGADGFANTAASGVYRCS